MTEKEEDDPYVIHGASLIRVTSLSDDYVNHGKNLIAEVSVTAHSDLVSFLTHEGLIVSSEHGAQAEAETVTVHISGQAELVERSMTRFVEQNPQIQLDMPEADE